MQYGIIWYMIYTQHILPYTNPFHVFDAFWSTCDNMHESKPTARKQFLYPTQIADRSTSSHCYGHTQ